MASLYGTGAQLLARIVSIITLYEVLGIASASVLYGVLYQLLIKPYLVSPLRHIPGPPVGWNPILGNLLEVVRGEAGIPQRNWVKRWGRTIRVVGPVGFERMIYTRPEALHQILVSGWLECPRVRVHC